jgi:hypothetical protein
MQVTSRVTVEKIMATFEASDPLALPHEANPTD